MRRHRLRYLLNRAAGLRQRPPTLEFNPTLPFASCSRSRRQCEKTTAPRFNFTPQTGIPRASAIMPATNGDAPSATIPYKNWPNDAGVWFHHLI